MAQYPINSLPLPQEPSLTVDDIHFELSCVLCSGLRGPPTISCAYGHALCNYCYDPDLFTNCPAGISGTSGESGEAEDETRVCDGALYELGDVVKRSPYYKYFLGKFMFGCGQGCGEILLGSDYERHELEECRMRHQTSKDNVAEDENEAVEQRSSQSVGERDAVRKTGDDEESDEGRVMTEEELQATRKILDPNRRVDKVLATEEEIEAESRAVDRAKQRMKRHELKTCGMWTSSTMNELSNPANWVTLSGSGPSSSVAQVHSVAEEEEETGGDDEGSVATTDPSDSYSLKSPGVSEKNDESNDSDDSSSDSSQGYYYRFHRTASDYKGNKD